ncbi:MAG: tetratricopeptide repeat protein [Nitrospirae bacterium]|nr:tetratricopeptide repeat protein [Nitrospirota bacterium]
MISSEFIDSFFSSTLNSQAQYDSLANNSLANGIDLYQKGDYAGAVRQFRTSIGISPFTDNSASAYNYMAMAYQKMDKAEDAIRTYKEAISVYPTRDSFHLSLGDVYLQTGRPAEAEKEYTAAVRLNPTSAENRYSLGKMYLDSARYSEAEVQFKQVTELSPNSASGYYGLGQVFRKKGEYSDAIAQLNKALSVNKSFDSAISELGYTYADMGEMDKAGEQVSILSAKKSSLAVELQGYIYDASAPKIILAYSTNGFNSSLGAGTAVSGLNDVLASANARKTFTMRFGFSKDMDIASVQNPYNWEISRSTGAEVGGAYNWGLKIPSTEVGISAYPISVRYNAKTSSADVTFSIVQNGSADATIDPSHIMFRFSGLDAYGKAMNTSADQYSKFSKIV